MKPLRLPSQSPLPISERDFQDTVIEMARILGFLVHHNQDSRRSEPGIPDLLIVSLTGRPRLIFAELKATGGKLTNGRYAPKSGRWLRGQRGWLSALERCVSEFSPVEVYLWFPQDMDTIERILRDGPDGKQSIALRSIDA